MQTQQAQQAQQESPFSNIQLDAIFKEEVVSLPVCASSDQTCTMYRADYISMLPHRWLRTAPIDYLIKVLLQRQLDEIGKIYASRGIISEEEHRQYVKVVDVFVVTMIMTYEDKGILQSLESLDLFSSNTKYLLIPINTENASGSHWALGCFINGHFKGGKDTSQLLMFDSTGSSKTLGHTLKAKLQNLFSVLTKETTLNIQIHTPENVLHQTNNYDCGIFAIGFAEYILKEIVNQLQERQDRIRLDRLSNAYKYLLGNSTLAREKYRRMLEQEVLKGMQGQEGQG